MRELNGITHQTTIFAEVKSSGNLTYVFTLHFTESVTDATPEKGQEEKYI